MRLIRLFLLVVIPGILLSSSSSEPIQNILSGYKKYLEELPQEKIFIHSDRPYYLAGETMWLKVYLTAGAYHEPSPFSHTIYIELFDHYGNSVLDAKFLATEGSANGQLHIPDSLPSGNYVLRSYTNWMKNFSVDYFFHKEIKIWQANEAEANTPERIDKLDLQFFPEGGELIAGLRNRVAFKAVGSDGLGLKVKGKLVDDQNQTITTFESNIFGMGSFLFTPDTKARYEAVVEQSPFTFGLPEARETGTNMIVTNNSDMADIVVRIQTNEQTKNAISYVLAQTRGVVSYATKITITNTVMFVKIPKKNFLTGISQITLLNESGLPYAERLVFVENKSNLSVSLSSTKQSYKPRELVQLNLQVKDEAGNPVISDFSLAVCDSEQVLLDENAETILSYLYLSSDLRGNIESPGYYFNVKNTDRREALDNLLLTQGWRRFLIRDAMSQTWPEPKHKFEQGLTLKGKLIDKFNNKPIVDGKVTYLITSPAPNTKVIRTNSAGEFEFNHLTWFNTPQAVLQGETRKSSKLVKFVMDSVVVRPPLTMNMSPLSLSRNSYEREFIRKGLERKQIDKAFNFDQDAIVLDAVEVQGKKEESTGVIRMYGSGSSSIKVSENPGLENLLHPLQLLQGRMAGVQVTGSGLSWTVTIRGVGSIGGSNTPLILVNNIQVQMDNLSQVPVRDIESVEVWKGADAAVFGSEGANGVIAFYTKSGKSVYLPREGIYEISVEGFSSPKEFYSPQYDVKKPEHAKPDKRVTLFWAPLIKTDSLGNATISFYNHDDETTISCIINGRSSSGAVGTASYQYQIVN